MAPDEQQVENFCHQAANQYLVSNEHQVQNFLCQGVSKGVVFQHCYLLQSHPMMKEGNFSIYVNESTVNIAL